MNIGKWKWKKTVMGRGRSGKFPKGYKRNVYLVLICVHNNTTFCISPIVFGLRRELWYLVTIETHSFSQSGKFSKWAVYILRSLHFSLQKNACLGASPTPAPALFPWPGPMSPMVGVGGAVSTPWKCPSVPSSFQISLCTMKTSAAS